jgi:8-oxo-dGTP pyrophosphatase MutT (NUDIX family)
MAKPVPKVVNDIKTEDLEALCRRGLRPGIKALFYHQKKGEVLLGRLPEGYPKRFNLPGGGIDPGQSAATALERELEEELEGPTFTKSFLMDVPVVAEGYLPFLRDEFVGKYEFIVALPTFDLSLFSVKTDSKLVLLPPMHWLAASKLIRLDPDCGEEMVSMYTRAVQAIRELVL